MCGLDRQPYRCHKGVAPSALVGKTLPRVVPAQLM
jgi:hypothetical protein